MIDDAFAALALGLALFAYCIPRSRATCPTMNEYVEGVRRDGSTWCARSPSIHEIDCTPLDHSCTREPDYTVPIKITCTGTV